MKLFGFIFLYMLEVNEFRYKIWLIMIVSFLILILSYIYVLGGN